MQKVRIYHNPKCSKSRAVLELLEAREVDLEVVNYLEQPLTVQELQDLFSKMRVSPREVMRTDVPTYQEQRLSDEKLSDKELIAAIATEPALLNRPIVVTEKGAKLCRTIELVQTLL